MKTNLKIFGSILAVCISLTACDKSDFTPLPDQKDPIGESKGDSSEINDSLVLGDLIIKPLSGSLSNLVSGNFEAGGRNYYNYQLKLEKLYPGHVVYSNGGESRGDLSFSLNIKFYSDLENGPVDEEYSIVLLEDPELYYKALDKSYAVDKKAIAFIQGDRSFDPSLIGKEYAEYLHSHLNIKSGSFHIKKSDGPYLVSFEGETETGERVSCTFNDTVYFIADNQIEISEEDFSLTEISGNYIRKGGKFYKLDDGYYYCFAPSSYNGTAIQTVQVITIRDYYWYENNYYRDEEYSGIDNQHWKSNAVFLQFQFGNLNQFQARTYQVAPSDGIHSIGYGLGALRNIPFDGFPNDSHLIGYYHIATDAPFTFTYDEDPDYMRNQIALKSGQLEVTKHSSEYEFSGSFTDANGEEVIIKFKAAAYPWPF